MIWNGGLYHSIGKGAALKIFRKKVYLSNLGNLGVPVSVVLKQTIKFLLHCYNQGDKETMTEARQYMSRSIIARSIGGAPKLQKLAPTTASYKENILRAHLQTAIWLSATRSTPPTVDYGEYGWIEEDHSYVPVPVPSDTQVIPYDLQRIIICVKNC